MSFQSILEIHSSVAVMPVLLTPCFFVFLLAGAASSANSASSEQNVSQFQTWVGVKPYNLLNFYHGAQCTSFVRLFDRLLGLLSLARPQCRPHATPCGDSQTKEMCKSDLTLVRECG